MGNRWPVKLSQEAWERLCDITWYLENELDKELSYDDVCSTIICQVELYGGNNEASA